MAHSESIDSELVLGIFIGTGMLSQANLPCITDRALTIAVDATAELSDIRPPKSVSNFFALPLGKHDSLNALINTMGTAEQKAVIRSYPTIMTTDGLCQFACVGGFAAKKLISDPTVESFLTEHLTPLLSKLPKGVRPRLRVKVYVGIAGGVGALGGPTLVEHLGQHFAKEFRAVLFEIYLIGNRSYIGPGFTRTRLNGPASLMHWISLVNTPRERISYTVISRETRPVGKDRCTRDYLLLQEQLAIESPVVNKFIETNRTNDAATSEFGCFYTLDNRHYQHLEISAIAESIASQYLSVVDDLSKESPELGTVDKFDYAKTCRPVSRESIDSALFRALDTTGDELIASVCRPESEVEALATVYFKDGSYLRLVETERAFRDPLSSLLDVRKRLRLLKTCLSLCNAEIARLEPEVELLTERLEDQREAAMHAINVLQGNEWSLTSDETRIFRAEQSLTSCRELFDELTDRQIELGAAITACRFLTVLHERLCERISRLQATLRERIPNGSIDSTRLLVKPHTIDSVFDSFWELSNYSPNTSAFERFCESAVAEVTIAGLARISHADEASVDRIVDAVLSGSAIQSHCPWGGDLRTDKGGHEFLVYPPVDSLLAAEIVEQHCKHGFSRDRVAFCARALGCVNIVRVGVFNCKRLEDILTDAYQAGITEIEESPLRPLFVGNGDIYRRLGIEFASSNGKSKNKEMKG